MSHSNLCDLSIPSGEARCLNRRGDDNVPSVALCTPDYFSPDSATRHLVAGFAAIMSPFSSFTDAVCQEASMSCERLVEPRWYESEDRF